MAKFDAIEQDDFPTAASACSGAARCCRRRCSCTGWSASRTRRSRTSTARPRRRSRAATTRCPSCRPSETEPIPIGVAVRGRGAARARRGAASRSPTARSATSTSRGVGLSPGYWRDEEKTAAAFVAGPARRPAHADLPDRRPGRVGDGRARPLPRARRLADQEPRLPDRARRDRDGAERAVRARRVARSSASTTGGFEGTAICCAYAPADGRGRRARRRAAAARRRCCPTYMLPSRWHVMDGCRRT